MAILYKKCPKCNSRNSVRIVYGMPSYELFKEAEAGEIKLGGCSIMEGSPEYFCKECEHKWNMRQAIDNAYSSIKTIKASVGGYFGGYNNVNIDLINLETTWSTSLSTEGPKIKYIDRIALGDFIEQLKIVNFLNWKVKYIEPEVCDGTKWSVKIKTKDRIILKHGDNKFPEEWNLFCSLIEQITGQDFR